MKTVLAEGSTGATYTITIHDGGKDPYCSCPAWRYHPMRDAKSGFRTCKHINANRAKVMRATAEELGFDPVAAQQSIDFADDPFDHVTDPAHVQKLELDLTDGVPVH
jgi:hypothetical protein